jgi:hypothetical protein
MVGRKSDEDKGNTEKQPRACKLEILDVNQEGAHESQKSLAELFK